MRYDILNRPLNTGAGGVGGTGDGGTGDAGTGDGGKGGLGPGGSGIRDGGTAAAGTRQASEGDTAGNQASGTLSWNRVRGGRRVVCRKAAFLSGDEDSDFDDDDEDFEAFSKATALVSVSTISGHNSVQQRQGQEALASS